MVALQISPKLESLCGLGRHKPQNYKDLYAILQLLRGSHLNNFLLKTLKLGWIAFHSVTLQLKCLDFQSSQYKKLVPVLSRFCNWQKQNVCSIRSSPAAFLCLLLFPIMFINYKTVNSKRVLSKSRFWKRGCT